MEIKISINKEREEEVQDILWQVLEILKTKQSGKITRYGSKYKIEFER